MIEQSKFKEEQYLRQAMFREGVDFVLKLIDIHEPSKHLRLHNFITNMERITDEIEELGKKHGFHWSKVHIGEIDPKIEILLKAYRSLKHNKDN